MVGHCWCENWKSAILPTVLCFEPAPLLGYRSWSRGQKTLLLRFFYFHICYMLFFLYVDVYSSSLPDSAPPPPPLRLSKVVSRQHRSIPNSSRGYRISLNTHFFKLTRRFNSIVTFLKMIVWLFNIVDSFQIFYKYFVLKFVLTPLNSILGHLLKGLSWLFCVYCSHLFQIQYCIKKWGVKRNHQTCPTGKT